MDLLYLSTEAWEQLLLNKNLPRAVTHHPRKRNTKRPEQFICLLHQRYWHCSHSGVWKVCSSHITSFEHYTLYCLTPDTDCITDIVKIIKPFHLITWFMKPIAILKRRQSVAWWAQSHMSRRQNQFDHVKSKPQVMRLIWCNRFKVPVLRWWMMKLWQRRRMLN